VRVTWSHLHLVSATALAWHLTTPSRTRGGCTDAGLLARIGTCHQLVLASLLVAIGPLPGADRRARGSLPPPPRTAASIISVVCLVDRAAQPDVSAALVHVAARTGSGKRSVRGGLLSDREVCTDQPAPHRAGSPFSANV